MENKLRRPFGILSRISTLIPLLNFSSCIDSHQNCAIRCHRTPLSSDTSYLKRLGCRAFDLGQQQAQHQWNCRSIDWTAVAARRWNSESQRVTRHLGRVEQLRRRVVMCRRRICILCAGELANRHCSLSAKERRRTVCLAYSGRGCET